MTDYEAFLKRKFKELPPTGFECEPQERGLFPHQRDLVRWAVRRGRAAIFADTGLGKSRMQVEWARLVSEHSGLPVLILAPLSVAAQTAREGEALGVVVKHVRDGSDVGDAKICITNYDRLHRFDTSHFGAVVLDESSCIKHFQSKTLSSLLAAFGHCRYRLACTATPAPNDYTELGTHAEFLGICSRPEMLAEFFVHDSGKTQDWRLKGHARAEFWRWLATWGALVRRPSDLGYDDGGYNLPELAVVHHAVETTSEDAAAAGVPHLERAESLTERRWARKASLAKRVEACAALAKETDERWVIWCELNAEQDSLAASFGDDCISIFGSLDSDEKERRMAAFLAGKARVLIGKPSIFGFGVNLQLCARIAFVGLSDSFESYYQAVRRCWRFGQTRAVEVHIFSSAAEGAVIENIQRKQADALAMAEQLSVQTREIVRESVLSRPRRHHAYEPGARIALPGFMRRSA